MDGYHRREATAEIQRSELYLMPSVSLAGRNGRLGATGVHVYRRDVTISGIEPRSTRLPSRIGDGATLRGADDHYNSPGVQPRYHGAIE
jgi:hypothetical protein